MRDSRYGKNARPASGYCQTQFAQYARLPCGLGSTVWLIVAAVVAMLPCHVLYESFIHPITILNAAYAGRRRAAGADHRWWRARYYRHYRHFADRHREEKKRHHDDFDSALAAEREQDESARRYLPCLSAVFDRF